MMVTCALSFWRCYVEPDKNGHFIFEHVALSISLPYVREVSEGYAPYRPGQFIGC